jgi:hypothetical protein
MSKTNARYDVMFIDIPTCNNDNDINMIKGRIASFIDSLTNDVIPFITILFVVLLV